MPKGFVLTMDAILALSVAIIMSGVIIGIISLSQGVDYSINQQLFYIGNDFLAVMDFSGKLKGYIGQPDSSANPDIGQQLQLLPNQYCGDLALKIYSTTGNPATIDYNNPETHGNMTPGCIKRNEAVKVKRIFVQFSPQKFGFAELQMWLR